MSEVHTETNYLAIFWWLLALTILEIGVIYMPITKMMIAILLVGMAVTKAALVAIYFMHLKYEHQTLTWIALSPFILCVFLILMLIPGLS